VPRRNLGAPPAHGQLLQRVVERQAHLGGVPSPSEVRGSGLAPADLHTKAVEAEGSRTVGLGMRLVAEAVTSLARATTGAERRLQWRVAARHRSGTPRRSAIERQLLTVIDLPKSLRHVSHPSAYATLWLRRDKPCLVFSSTTLRRGYDRLGHVKKGAGKKGKGERAQGAGGQGASGQAERGPASIDALYQLPLTEFTSARNALATRLRKSGKTADADEVRTLVKPSIPAWAVNQVYWKHRAAFDRLLAAGDEMRKAQSSTLAGKSGDVRGALDGVREALSELARLAADALETAGHNATPGAMRAVTATLEALSAYGTIANAPRPGRLVDEVDPPGFETLAALVPNAGGSGGSDEPSRILQFQPQAPAPSRRKSGSDSEERREEERQAKLAAAKAAVEEADRNLRDARSTAQEAQASLKKAAASAKDTEQAMIDAEQVLDKAAKDAHTARQLARRLAAEAEAAAQAVDEAERAVTRAKKAVEEI
jgi:hypothetical protein